jgi:plastocyanin
VFVQGKSGALRVVTGMTVVGAIVGSVGVAAAVGRQAADATISTTPQNRWNPAEVEIQTGQTVVWNFDGSTADHNVRGESGPAEDTLWPTKDSGFKRSGQETYTFNVAGDYHFVCDAHPGMEGTVKVSGAPVEPTPVPTAEPTAAPTVRPPSPAPVPGAVDDRRTPAPRGTVRADTTPPAVTKIKLRAVKGGAKVSFSLSESASVTIRAKKGKTTVRTVRLAARSGTRSATLRKLARARYRVEVEARDARGNKAPVQRKTVRVKR